MEKVRDKKTLNWIDLSSTKMQDVLDKLYANYGLPFKNESVHGLLAEVLPQLVAQIPPLEFKDCFAGRRLSDGKMWDPAEHILYTPFERFMHGMCPLDKKMDLRCDAVYARMPTVSGGPEFAEVRCYCYVAIVDRVLTLEMECRVDPMEKKAVKNIDAEKEPLPFAYVIDALSYISVRQGLRLIGEASPHAVEARCARIESHNELRDQAWQKNLAAFRSLPEGEFFRYTQGIAMVGEETMSNFTHEMARGEDWIHISNIPDDECIEHYVSIYRPDGRGGLRRIEICEVRIPFDAGLTDESLVKLFLKTRR